MKELERLNFLVKHHSCKWNHSWNFFSNLEHFRMRKAIGMQSSNRKVPLLRLKQILKLHMRIIVVWVMDFLHKLSSRNQIQFRYQRLNNERKFNEEVKVRICEHFWKFLMLRAFEIKIHLMNENYFKLTRNRLVWIEFCKNIMILQLAHYT